MNSQIRLQQNAPGGTPDTGTALLSVGTDGRLYISLASGTTLPVGNELAVDAATISVSAAATAALFTNTFFAQLAAKIIAGAGSGTYTVNYTLPTAGMLAASIVMLDIELPAGSNPTVNIYDSSTGGTLLATFTNSAPAAAQYWYAQFKFGLDGHWHKQFTIQNS